MATATKTPGFRMHGQPFTPTTLWFRMGLTVLNIDANTGMVYRVWHDGLVAETGYDALTVRQMGTPCDPIEPSVINM